MKRAACFLVLCLTLTAFGFSSGVFIRLGGGADYLLGGDYNTIIQGRNDYYNSLSGFSVSGQLNKMKIATHLIAEFVYDPVDYAGVGLGVGYVHATSDSQITAAGASDNIVSVFTPLLTAFSLVSNVHLTLPLGERLSVYVSGGPGIYFGGFQFNNQYTETLGSIKTEMTFDSNTKTAFGLQGAVGFELGLSESAFVFIEVAGRSVKLTGVSGKYQITGSAGGKVVLTSGNGTYWYQETASNGSYFPDWSLSATQPSGSSLRNVREMSFSLGGVGIVAGLKIEL